MTIKREELVLYRAVCDGCGRTGPAHRSAAGAIESVTAEATSRHIGFSLVDRWGREGERLWCGTCRERVWRERTGRGHPCAGEPRCADVISGPMRTVPR